MTGQAADIVLSTLNAKFIHTSFGLRYLMANMGDLQGRTRMLEFDLKTDIDAVVAGILAHAPRIAGLGVYIWNAAPMLDVVRRLKQARPDIVVVLGGPEVSFETDRQEICSLADYVISGEADLAFRELCAELLSGTRPPAKAIAAETPDPASLIMPYNLYDDKDIAHRMIYVESSRGCPFRCEYCVSSHDSQVRCFPIGPLLAEFKVLIERGVQLFKFADRTFNLNIERAIEIMEFFLANMRPNLVCHFEMIPDRFPGNLRSVIERFPPGSLRLETGIQSFNPVTLDLISRKQDPRACEESLAFLRDSGAIVHADLIAGLPGETLESFASGFDRLFALRPREIQLGILKRLRGAPIVRHDAEWEMIYSPESPYEILSNRLIDRKTMDRIKRFARYWELVVNRGRFLESAQLIWRNASSVFADFMRFSDYLHARFGRAYGIALPDLAEALFDFLTLELMLDRKAVADSILRDYRPGRRDVPAFLRP